MRVRVKSVEASVVNDVMTMQTNTRHILSGATVWHVFPYRFFGNRPVGVPLWDGSWAVSSFASFLMGVEVTMVGILYGTDFLVELICL